MMENKPAVPQTALPRVNQSAKWNSRIIENGFFCSPAAIARSYHSRAPDCLIRPLIRYDAGVRIATFNVNSINARLPNLLRWLEQTAPDVVCLQELKAPQENFPEAAIRDAGYGVIWHGQKSWNGVAILARNAEPVEIRRVLPGDPDDVHSRYIEATVHGLTVGCLYLPNGNPAPGPKYDYKLKWLARLLTHAA